jgi:hypothetical protein
MEGGFVNKDLLRETLICRTIRVLVVLQLRRYPVNDIRDGKVATNSLDVVNSIRPKQSFQNTRNKINHDDTTLLPEHHGELCKYFHALFIYD